MTRKKKNLHKQKIQAPLPKPDGSTPLLEKTDPMDELRRQAEKIARGEAAPSPESIEAMSPEEIRRTLHELQVHQIELEMQNEELHRTQAELEASRARYFDLYDLAPVGYFTVSEKGLILEANLKAAILLRVVRGALIKQPIAKFILKEDQNIYYLLHKQLFEASEQQACELRMVTMDGEAFWAHLEATAAQDADGTTVFRIVMSDNPERKRMAESLLESELNLRNIIDQLEDVFFAIDNSGFITFISPSVLQMFGWKLEEVVGRSFIEFLPETEIPAAVTRFKDALTSGQKTQNLCFIMKRKDESTFPGELNSSVVWKNGRSAGMVGIIRDITERKEAEEALRRAEENFRRSLDESPLGVRIVTIEGETLYANRAILNIYGYDSIDELKTTPVKMRYTQESYDEFRIRLKKRRQGLDVPSEYTIDIIRKNGDIRNLRVFRKDILWDDERQYQVIYEDITERKLAEEALAAKSQQLEQTNTALQVLLQHREEDLRQTEQKIVANLQKLVLPYIKELRKLRLSPSQLNYLEIIDSNLQQVINPFLQNLAARFSVLTPREIQVSSLIKEGKTTKEIADLIKAAPRSVEFHRNNIRKKLGLSGKKTNLRSFLLTLS